MINIIREKNIMITKKETFVTEDGTEFSTVKEARKHGNLCFMRDRFGVNTEKDADQFVEKIDNHGMGGLNYLFKEAHGVDWRTWNEEAFTEFSDITQRVFSHIEKGAVMMQFFMSDKCPSIDAMYDGFGEVKRPKEHTWEEVIKVLPRGSKKKYREMSKFNEHGKRLKLDLDEELSDDFQIVYRLTKEEMSAEDKLNNGIELSEEDLYRLVSFNAVHTDESAEYDDWSHPIRTVVEIGGEQYLIRWARGLTELQEDEFDHQPVKCHMETREVVQTVVDIIED